MVSIANWATVFMKQLRIFPNPKNNSNLLTELLFEIRKAATSTSNIDRFGIVAGYTFISIVPSVFTVSFAIVISDIDLVFIVLRVIFNIIGFNQYLLSRWYFQIIRYLSYVYIYQCIAVIGPTFTALIAACGQFIISTTVYIKTADLSYSSIKLFKVMVVTKNFVFHMMKMFNSIFLSGSFFILLISTNLTFYGKEVVPKQLYVSAPFLAFTFCWGTAFVLHYETFIYELTSRIIDRWKSQLVLGVTMKSKYTKLVVNSLQPIAMPVGNIGIVDRDVQINYFNAVLNYIVNTSILFKDFF